jgi:glycosyltransferase involved in cell wall biosynthesis
VARNISYVLAERRLLRTFRPDVLLVTGSYCTVAPMLAAKVEGVPLVLHCDTLMEYEYTQFYRQYYSYPMLGRWLERLALRTADQVICISDIMQGYLLHYGIPMTKLHVVPNGVDHRAIRPESPDPAFQDRLGLTSQTVVGFLGTFQFFDDPETFMDVVHALCKRHPRLVFLLIGEWNGTSRTLRQAADRRGIGTHVRFPGPISHDEVSRYLALMDIVLCPYRGDYLFYGSSMKLLEYMAAGKATVATALGQIKEVIADGENGFLFEWRDHQALQSKLDRLIQDQALRERLGVNARATIERRWTWDRQIQRLETLLRSTVEDHR